MHLLFVFLSFASMRMTLMSRFVDSAPFEFQRKSLRSQLNPDYIRAVAAYKRLEPKMSREELRAITTIGIMNGVAQTEQAMEENMVTAVKDLLLHTETLPTIAQLNPKVDKIEKQVMRDRNALEILLSALDLATRNKDAKDFKKDMQIRLKHLQQEQNSVEMDTTTDSENATRKRIAALRHSILKNVTEMKQLVAEKIQYTLSHLMNAADKDSVLAKATSNHKVGPNHKRRVDNWREEPVEIRLIKSILTEEDFRNNLIDFEREKGRDDNESLLDLDDLTRRVKANRVSKQIAIATTKATTTTTMTGPPIKTGTLTPLQPTAATTSTTKTVITATNNSARPVKQEEGSPEFDINDDQGGGGGGLLGVIASLSGGEGGFDVGALVGALTGLVSTLFGPGGLDVEILISTASSLISGLLAGNKDFGTVLGQYVGTAFDGFSGGGGAVNNGQFVGNLLGTVVASLSADPEDDDEPPKPFIFLQNFLSSFVEAKNRKASGEEESGERNGGGGAHDNIAPPAWAGSDSVGFIKHIVSHVVGGAVSLILNAALGASGGASQASSSLFGSSSGGHKLGGAGNDNKMW